MSLYTKTKGKIAITNLAPAMTAANWSGASDSTAHSKYSGSCIVLSGTTDTAEVYASTASSLDLKPTHVYYIRSEVYAENSSARRTSVYWPIAEPPVYNNKYAVAGQWTMFSAVTNRSGFSEGSYQMRVDFDNDNKAGSMWFDGVMVIDLTETFGSGKEPDVTWCDNNIGYFVGTSRISYDGAPIVTTEVSKLQIGVRRQVPIYETTTVTKTGPICNYANLNEYFIYTQGSSYGWTLSENTSSVKLVPQNFGINSSTATITLTATRNISNLVITGAYYTESRYDKITLTVAGSTKLSAVSGTSALATRVSGVSITKGQTVIFTYAKDSSSHASSETRTYFTLTCDPYTETVTENVITGYEEKLLPTDIIGGWIKKGGVARQFLGGGPDILYTGTHTLTQIEKDGVTYNLLTITDSGTLTIGSGNVEVWMCGGGGGGYGSRNGYGTTTTGVSGGGGGGGYVGNTVLNEGEYIITIGKGAAPTYSENTSQGTSSTIIRNNTTLLNCLGGNSASYRSYPLAGSGGSGGGSGAYGMGYSGRTGAGANVSTYPFNIISLQAHCAGGGGGGLQFNNSNDGTSTKGGDGGSNGSSGKTTTSNTGSNTPGGSGGIYGGGNGGVSLDSSISVSKGYAAGNGTNGTFYGAGGGGGGRVVWYSGGAAEGKGGTGYQGVCYVLWPKS